ncbi:MAG: LCP family protein [Actinomycetota bacterium]
MVRTDQIVSKAKAPKNRTPLYLGAAVFAVFCVGGARQLVSATDAQLSTVRRDLEATSALSAPSAGFENYLLVGSDSREGADPNDPDYKAIGGDDDVSGRRSDTVMIFHHDFATGAGALLSFPRDLWVRIGDGENSARINTAYREGSDVLVRTVQNNFNIPVHHYLEIDFQGFKGLVDAIGGVEICVQYPSRDKNSGLYIPPGCHNLNGVRALAFARRRYFVSRIANDWQLDGSSDIGRGKRQRKFITAMLSTAMNRVLSNPFTVSEAFGGVTGAIIIDDNLDLTEFAKKMRPAAKGDISRFSLDVYSDSVAGNSILRLGEGSAAVLAFFGGLGPAPEPES